MSVQFFQHLLNTLKKKELVLATVIQTSGSVPREIGAKMIICADGETINTIGGGAGEAKVCRIAQTVLKTGKKQKLTIDLSGVSHKTTEGVCGGTMQVWLEKWSGESAIALGQEILNYLKSGKKITLFTPFSSSESPYLLLKNLTEPSAETGFSEIVHPPPLLLIIGAGHVGEQLAKVGNMLGFNIFIQDDRPEWANKSRYPQATQIFTDSISVALPQFVHYQPLYLALVTRGYQYDLEALKTILDHQITYNYLGMIGSKKRIQAVKKALAKLNFSPSYLTSFYAPIGLDIGALTPEEIAISIGAELILVQRGGTGRPLSVKKSVLA